MKQRDLLFAGLLLLGVPAFAQVFPDTPDLNDPRNAKVMFTQDFEDGLDFTKLPVDTIDGVQYWTKTGSGNLNNKVIYTDNGWMKANPPVTKGLIRDTTIILYNAVKATDQADSAKWDSDDFDILEDQSPERKEAFKNFGEDGGKYVFKYVSGIPEGKSANGYTKDDTNGGYGANYRRNLFVRGLPIEDESSYRLTFYLKVKPVQDYAKNKRFYADVMRGYYAAEKPFSMGLEDNAGQYKYKRTFALEKTAFTGDWEKVTMMTYYLNDSIADGFVFVDGYWWSDEWKWPADTTFAPKAGGGEDTIINHPELHYHVQPDKFFVRLSFASDSTEFYVDNLSLTKSWIAGCEYYADRLRVDFGYETNLKKLAKQAQRLNKLPVVEVPGKYFAVYGLDKGGDRDNPDDWFMVDIASAEYQISDVDGKGYMYMFTDWVDDNDHSKGRQSFDDFDEVLVNFTNPEEDELKLYYTGNLFPKALDVEWIKAGKLVPNFYNEIATPNSFIFQGVYSMYDRGPALKACLTKPDNSFGLDGGLKEFKFEFTKEMVIDNPANAEARTRCIVYVGTEIWDRAWDGETNTLTITRPAKYTTPLNGDYEIQINALYDKNNTDHKSPNEAIHYNFGAIDRDVQATEVAWKTNFSDPRNTETKVKPVNCAFSRYSAWSSSKYFVKGDGTKDDNFRIYFHDDAEKYKRTYLVTSRGSQNGPGAIYFGYLDTIMISAYAQYNLAYTAYQLNRSMPVKIYVYPWVADPLNLSADDKELVATINPMNVWPEKDGDGNDRRDYTDNDTLLVPVNIGFSTYMGGRSIIEIAIDGDNKSPYTGYMISDLILYQSPISFNPVVGLNNAVAEAQTQAGKAADEKYSGKTLNDLTALINKYKKDAAQPFSETDPAAWTAAVEALNAAALELKLRMDTVDLVVAKTAEVKQKLNDVKADSAIWVDVQAYKTLKETFADANSYEFSEYTTAQMTAFIKLMDDQMKALDVRVANNKDYIKVYDKADALIKAEEHKDYEEYAELKSVFESLKDFDAIKADDDVLAEKYAALKEAAGAYNRGILLYKYGTERIFALKALATELGSDIANDDLVKAQLADLREDNEKLAKIFKAAIKAQIYETASVTEKDLTPFIKNYNLYATPIIENPGGVDKDGKAVRDGGSTLAGVEPAVDGANIYQMEHRWTDGKQVYVILFDKEITNLLPGWTVKHVDISDGNRYASVDSTTSAAKYGLFESGDPVFDGAISIDWNTKVEMSTEVTDLPVGVYELSTEVRNEYRYENRRSEKVESYLKANTAEQKFKTGYLRDTIFVEGNDTTWFTQDDSFVNDTVVTISVKNVEVTDGKLAIAFMLESANGNNAADNFKLGFAKKTGFDYAGAAAAAKQEITDALTFVDAKKAVAGNVEFYTLSGMKIATPKKGEILIRKTTQANGKVVVDKVMLK